jgi:hypothetical protein
MSDERIERLVNDIISYPVGGLARFVANAIQAGTKESPIPISPSALKEYNMVSKRLTEMVKSAQSAPSAPAVEE